jgi:hypothetical protein
LTHGDGYVLLLFLLITDVHFDPDPADILAEAHRLALKALREKAMDIASRLHAASEQPDADLGAIAGQFARVARAVRQTIVLESRLAEEDVARRYETAAIHAEQAAERRKQRGRTRVRDVMTAAKPVFAAAEKKTLNEDFAWRLERLNDHDPDFPDRPVEDVIAEICETLRVANPLARPAGGACNPLPLRERVATQSPGEGSMWRHGSERQTEGEPPSPDPAQASASHRPLTRPVGPPSPARGEGPCMDAPVIPERAIVNWGGPAPDTG